MPQRVVGILIAVFGTFTVLLIAAVGWDVFRAAKTGPRWKRKLVAAGLMLLATLGLGGYAVGADRADAKARLPEPAARVSASDEDLQKTREWKTIREAWDRITPIARSGVSTTRQRQDAEKAMDKASAAIETLAAAGSLSKAEAGLLQSEAEQLLAQMVRNPPTDCQVNCYKMAYMPPARNSLRRINQRLPLLRQAVASGKIGRAVTAKVLPSIEADLAILVSEQELAKLPEDERAKATAAVRDAAATVKQVKALVKAP